LRVLSVVPIHFRLVVWVEVVGIFPRSMVRLVPPSGFLGRPGLIRGWRRDRAHRLAAHALETALQERKIRGIKAPA
jgi:hypothetical protein